MLAEKKQERIADKSRTMEDLASIQVAVGGSAVDVEVFVASA